jgi:hypothetical protein
VTLRALALTLLLFLTATTPATAADVVLRTLDSTDLSWIDAYRDRVAWVEDDGRLWTVEDGAAVAVAVKRVDRLDVAAGPDGAPVAVYRRGARFALYDFAAKRERALKAPTGKLSNWAFWKDRFAVVRDGRLQIVPLTGRTRDIGRAKSLGGKAIDFDGTGVAYINQDAPSEDVEAFELAYWPATGPGKGRVVLRAAHGASGDLSLDGPVLSASKAYATQRGGEFGGPWRLWRVDLRSGTRDYAGLPGGTTVALPLGAEQAVAQVCPDAEDACRLVLRDVTYRR